MSLESDLTAEQRQCSRILDAYGYYVHFREMLETTVRSQRYDKKTNELLEKTQTEMVEERIHNLNEAVDWFEALTPEKKQRACASSVFVLDEFLGWFYEEKNGTKFYDAYTKLLPRLWLAVGSDDDLQDVWEQMNVVMGTDYPAKHPHAAVHPYPEELSSRFRAEEEAKRQHFHEQQQAREKKSRDKQRAREEKARQKQQTEQEGGEQQRRQSKSNSGQKKSSSSNASEGVENNYQKALAILELKDNAGYQILIERYRLMRSRMHPDKGGSNYMQQQVNWAYEYLVTIEKWTKAKDSPQSEQKPARPGEPSSPTEKSNGAKHEPLRYPDDIDAVRQRWKLRAGYSKKELDAKHQEHLGVVPDQAVAHVHADYELLEPYAVDA